MSSAAGNDKDDLSAKLERDARDVDFELFGMAVLSEPVDGS